MARSPLNLESPVYGCHWLTSACMLTCLSPEYLGLTSWHHVLWGVVSLWPLKMLKLWYFCSEWLGAPESFCSYSFWKKHAATFTLHMHSNDLFPATCGMKWPKCLLDPLADLIGLLNSTSTREKISFSVASETASIDEQSWSSMGS